MPVPTLEAAIASGDAFSIKAAAAEDAKRAYERGYLNGVQDQQVNLRYAMDTGPLTTPIAWFRFLDDAKFVKPLMDQAWEDLRIVNLKEGLD